MKTDLNARSSLFSKSKNNDDSLKSYQVQTQNLSASDEYLDINELVARANSAINERDAESLPWLQLEIQVKTMMYLKLIDWKMWEIHNRYVKP